MAYTRVHRLLKIITLLHGSARLNAARLAEICETGERNIYRDLNELQAAGVPISFDKETGGYSIRGDFFLRPVDLTLEEAMALILVGREVGQSEQLPHAGEAGKAIEKLLATLPAKIREMVDELLPRVSVDLARGANESDATKDVYGLVRQAITNRRALQCEYESRSQKSNGDTGKFRFDPYAMYYGQRAWYAIGLHHGRNEVRTLKLARFAACKSCDTPYFIPDNFSLDNYFGEAWRMVPSGTRTLYDIKLHFDPTVAETVADTHWHGSQECDWQPDDSIQMSFRVDGLEEIIYWILGYGPHCRVLSPPELAKRIRQLHQSAAEQYSH